MVHNIFHGSMVNFSQAGLGGPIIDHPDNRDTDPTMEYRNKVSAFIKKHFRSVASECGIYEPCICTVSWNGGIYNRFHIHIYCSLLLHNVPITMYLVSAHR